DARRGGESGCSWTQSLRQYFCIIVGGVIVSRNAPLAYARGCARGSVGRLRLRLLARLWLACLWASGLRLLCRCLALLPSRRLRLSTLRSGQSCIRASRLPNRWLLADWLCFGRRCRGLSRAP